TVTIALTGASGLPYGLRLIETLLAAGIRVWVLYSQAAQVVAKQEMDLTLPSRPAEMQAWL
ncbi:aromatic acid decarboxylase, partial [Chromobacterium piscinae]